MIWSILAIVASLAMIGSGLGVAAGVAAYRLPTWRRVRGGSIAMTMVAVGAYALWFHS